jgi:hypothetical protein
LLQYSGLFLGFGQAKKRNIWHGVKSGHLRKMEQSADKNK